MGCTSSWSCAGLSHPLHHLICPGTSEATGAGFDCSYSTKKQRSGEIKRLVLNLGSRSRLSPHSRSRLPTPARALRASPEASPCSRARGPFPSSSGPLGSGFSAERGLPQAPASDPRGCQGAHLASPSLQAFIFLPWGLCSSTARGSLLLPLARLPAPGAVGPFRWEPERAPARGGRGAGAARREAMLRVPPALPSSGASSPPSGPGPLQPAPDPPPSPSSQRLRRSAGRTWVPLRPPR